MPVTSISDPSTYTIVELAQPSDCAADGTSSEAPCTLWGAGLLESNDCAAVTSPCTYIYGRHDDPQTANSASLRVAVAPRGQMTRVSSWRYLTGAGWSAQETDASDLVSGIDTVDLDRWHGRYVMVAGESTAKHTGDIVAYYAEHPYTFAPTSRTPLFTPPPASDPGTPSTGHYTDQYRLHPAFHTESHLVLGYSTHSTAIDAACMNDAAAYDDYINQPRFYDVTLPAGPDPSAIPVSMPAPRNSQLTHHSLPPAQGLDWHDGGACDTSPAPRPTNVIASSDPSGVHLRWRNLGGMFWYFIEHCDIGVSSCSDPRDWSSAAPLTDQPCIDDPRSVCADTSWPAPQRHKLLYRVRAMKWSSSALSAPSNSVDLTMASDTARQVRGTGPCRLGAGLSVRCARANQSPSSSAPYAECRLWDSAASSIADPDAAMESALRAPEPHTAIAPVWEKRLREASAQTAFSALTDIGLCQRCGPPALSQTLNPFSGLRRAPLAGNACAA
jgi:hypothetical protein